MTAWRARLAGIPQRPVTSVVLAAIVLLMPFHFDAPAFGRTTIGQSELIALLALAIGWAGADLLAVRRIRIPVRLVVIAAVGVGLVVAGQLVGVRLARGPLAVVLLGFWLGAAVRGTGEVRRTATSLVVTATLASWITWDVMKLPLDTLRDLHLYLGAGTTALGGASPYLSAPLAAIPDSTQLPFVYPPLTIPLFELLALLPRAGVDLLWTAASLAAVLGTFWLLGVRGRWLIVLLAWPAPAQGIAVGNVASFSLFAFALAFPVAASIVVSGVFKLQSMIPSLWLLRERRWRALAVGIGIVVALAVISVPIVGLQTWLAWPAGLRFFTEVVNSDPGIKGLSVERLIGPVLAIVLSVALIVWGLRVRGRAGLARLGFASVVASPTLYPHGLSPLLAGALTLGPELLWFVLGMGPWAPGFQSGWIAMVLVGLALATISGDDLRPPADMAPARADLHPIGRLGQVWPEAEAEAKAPRA